ncbi:MAG: nicotinate (nicotinamide) nucleotide adenylyltransferase [Burkholderiales bacterium]|jgi:nicotinate (nicotinamide) nucleotide adenylyltransferase|nr:nicotinate (nicotinamide) nucleotide adenylyltransferase [Burkholderiales bacterium]
MNPLLPLRAVGLLGGTFDPVHEGHLAIARAVSAHFGLGQVRLIPARMPVHRATPMADAHHRLAMLRLVIAPYPELAVDTREIDSSQQNYTLWTLQSLRAEQPDAALLWIIGEDAFAQLPAWRRWQELFDVAHFVVINRAGTNPRPSSTQTRTPSLSPGGGVCPNKPPSVSDGHPLSKEGRAGERERPSFFPSPLAPLPQGERGAKRDVFSQERIHLNQNGSNALPEILQEAVASRLTEDKHALTSRSAGLVYHLTLPLQPASGTQIRAALAAGSADEMTDLLPAPVLAYIARHALYQVTTHGN